MQNMTKFRPCIDLHDGKVKQIVGGTLRDEGEGPAENFVSERPSGWFAEKFLRFLTPVSILALLATLILLFSFKGETILANPLTILWIAIPLTVQTLLIFAITYGAAKWLNLSYEDAAPSAMIGASNHFEVAIATAVMLFGLSSGAALATVVGVLIEVPLMLFLVRFCQRTKGWFPRRNQAA